MDDENEQSLMRNKGLYRPVDTAKGDLENTQLREQLHGETNAPGFDEQIKQAAENRERFQDMTRKR